MSPEYVATKSAWGAVTFLRVVFFWLIIPLIVMICHIVILKHEKIEFYHNQIVVKSGVLSKKQRKSAFMGVLSVSTEQSLFGRIFKYGDVRVDVPGKWDVNTTGISDPQALANYLETRIVSNRDATTIING